MSQINKKNENTRPTWDEYFMKLAVLASERATCDRAQVGCVFVKNHATISTGYNGSLPGNPHCDNIGHKMIDGHCLRTIHAEQNAILHCAKEGISTKDCIAYVTHYPCIKCAQSLISAGIKKVIYKEGYRIDSYAKELFKENSIETYKLNSL